MTLKANLAKQLGAADTLREQYDGETITFAGFGGSYTGLFSAAEDPYLPVEAGTQQAEQLRGVLRIDQFLADPAAFDPAQDYSAQLPDRSKVATLRGSTWSLHDTRTDGRNWLIILKKRYPRS